MSGYQSGGRGVTRRHARSSKSLLAQVVTFVIGQRCLIELSLHSAAEAVVCIRAEKCRLKKLIIRTESLSESSLGVHSRLFR